MKKTYNNIDELFKDKFRDFEVDPPEMVWENIKQNISDSNSTSMNLGGNRIISIIIAIVSVTLITSYFIFDGENSVTSDPVSIIAENTIQNKENIEPVSIKNIENAETDDLLKEDIEVEIEAESNMGATISEEKVTEIEAEVVSNNETTIEIENSIQKTESKKEEKLAEKTIDKEVEPNYSNSEEIQFASSDENNIIYNDETVSSDSFTTAIVTQEVILIEEDLPQNINNKLDVSIEKNNSKILEGDNTDVQRQDIVEENIIVKHRIKPQISLGAYFSPEVIFYPSDADNKKAYTVGLGLNFDYNGFVIESGLGLSFSEDNGNYKIDYEEYLGSYEDLLSITFDTTGPTVTPIFHTTTIDVYDSLNKISISQAKNNYTYLQIPLFFGFVKNNRRISYSLKGGPIMSFMINKNIPEVVLPEDKIKVIKIDKNIPTRINTNWQFAINVGFAYKLSNHLNISIEPTFRYYLRSVYNNDNNIITTKHPYSLGVRTGLIYKF